MPAIRRVVVVSRASCLGGSDGGRSARALVEALARWGLDVEALGRLDLGPGWAPGSTSGLIEQRWPFELVEAGAGPEGELGRLGIPRHARLALGGARVTLLAVGAGATEPNEAGERAAFLRLLDGSFDRGRPDVLIGWGDGPSVRDAMGRAAARGVAVALFLPDFRPRDPDLFLQADAAVVPSRFAAAYYREAFGIACTALPFPIEPGPGPAGRPGPRYVTFVDPTAENGVYAFARIADELGRRRPDIPLLVVEGRGTESTLAACGLDLRARGNVHLISPPIDPHEPWAVSGLGLMPTLEWEGTGRVAAGALAGGVPVLASDRGPLPELLGEAGRTLPLPDRLSAATGMLPTAEEVGPWVEAIVDLWDDATAREELRRKALEQARRWADESLRPCYLDFLGQLAPSRPPANKPAGIDALARDHPWPTEKPSVEGPAGHPGWLGAGTDALLARELSPDTRLVVELGAWNGMSARFIADHAPNATVISIDHWLGSTEHRSRPEFDVDLPTLHDSFHASCWADRERIIPLRMTSLDGLKEVAGHGLSPDLIYIDAEHTHAAVDSELELAHRLFPRTVLVGDDYDWDGVRAAVDGFARRRRRVVERSGLRGWKIAHPPRIDLADPLPGRSRSVVLVPHLTGIEWECESGLRRLEECGVRVVRRGGCSAIDLARNIMASDALHEGAEIVMFIDADIQFDRHDVLRLLARPEPVVAGIYTKKGERGIASVFGDGISEVVFGRNAEGLYPLKYAATGFLRIRADVLRRMIETLTLPLCNAGRWGRGIWPFFQPTALPVDGEGFRYLAEDWAFSHRLRQIGVTPLADTSIRLWHHGQYGFGWEDAGAGQVRYPSYVYRAEGRPPDDPSRPSSKSWPSVEGPNRIEYRRETPEMFALRLEPPPTRSPGP